MKKPTVIVPRCVKETVEKLFLIQRELDGSDLPVNLIGLDVSYFQPHYMLLTPHEAINLTI